MFIWTISDLIGLIVWLFVGMPIFGFAIYATISNWRWEAKRDRERYK